MHSPLPHGSPQRHTLDIGGFRILMETVPDFDAVLDHYARHHGSDTDMIPYYAQLWPSAEALARHLVERAGRLDGRRVLELGCGLGLPSLVAARLGAASVLATDFHPDNEPYLRRNVAINGLTNVAYRQLRWGDPPPGLAAELVLASDVLYEAGSVEPLVGCVDALLAPGGLAILTDPGRDHLQAAVNAFRERGFREETLARDNVFVVELRRGQGA